ncbi:hypothetical protein F5Y08DRAFT_296011 [Xylaria arbuscula]|nr:hypothetical protein F5Y08DRAFT_296011 [Xylaria arbuscula]
MPSTCCGIRFRPRLENGSGPPRKRVDPKPQCTPHVRPVAVQSQSARSISTPRTTASIPSPSTPSSSVDITENPGSVRLTSIGRASRQLAIQTSHGVQARTDLWEKAMATLSERDRAWIDKTSDESTGPVLNRVGTMIDLATEKQRQCEKSGWETFQLGEYVVSLGDITSKMIIWLNKFKEVGDILVQYDPVHAALPWAAVRFCLQAIVTTKEQMAASLAILEKATRIIHRCQVFEELYNRTTITHPIIENLESSLIQLYGRVLQGLIKAGQVLSETNPLKYLSAILEPDTVPNLLASLEDGEVQVDREVVACDAQRNAEVTAGLRKQLQSLLQLAEPVLRIDANIKIVLQQLEGNELTRILQWISPIEFRRHHDTIRELRTSNTCDWLLQRPKFGQWVSATSATTLWLQGFPGSGKTFLISRVIENIEETLSIDTNDESFAFFYCNRNEENRRNTLDILRSYVRQLSTTPRRSGLIFPELKQLYADSQMKGAGWTLGLCRVYLIKLLNLYPRTTLVLDALDECKPEERANLLDFFDSIPSECSKPVRIFISSRPEGDIRQRLNHLSNIEIQATDNENDIARFVMQSIEKNGRWSGVLRKNQPLKDRIVDTLLTQSNGMFQWAMLQIRQLLNLRTESEIYSRLGKLPKDLKTAYDEIFANIEALEAEAGALSVAALRWVMCAYRPLTSEVLLAAINVNPEKETVESFGIEEDDLLDWTANLLRLDAQQKPPVWRVSHLSVIEYLETRWTVLEAHCYVAKASLVLMRETFRGEDEGQLLKRTGMLNPFNEFQRYVRFHWIRHVQTQEDQDIDPKLGYLLKAFLGSLEESSVHYRGWHEQAATSNPWSIPPTSPIEPDEIRLRSFPDTSAIFVVCRFSFYNLLRDWWDKVSPEILQQRTKTGDHLFVIAAAGGCEPLFLRLYELARSVKMLVEKGMFGKALVAAAENGHLRILRVLLDRGADIDQAAYVKALHDALAAASMYGRGEVVRFLVDDKGADANYLFGPYTVLSHAADGGDMGIVRFLIERGADVNMLHLIGWFETAWETTKDDHLGKGGVIDFLNNFEYPDSEGAWQKSLAQWMAFY